VRKVSKAIIVCENTLVQESESPISSDPIKVIFTRIEMYIPETSEQLPSALSKLVIVE